MLLRDNVYGTIEEDAERRDFTVNALYYSAKDFTLHDFEGGLEDLAARRLELIGDPETRYREDPVRMLRAVRFAAKLDMTISPRTAAPIRELAPLLQDIPAARLFEETLKLFLAGDGLATYKLLREYGLFQPLFPQVAALFTPHGNSPYEQFIEQALMDTDTRVREEKRVTPAFLYATLLWGAVEARGRVLENESGLPWYDAFMLAINEVLDNQVRIIAVPRRFTTDVRDIWALQQRLTRRQGKHPERAMEHPKFRAAFDFLLLRNRVERPRRAGELVGALCGLQPGCAPATATEATRRPASGERADSRSGDGEKRSGNGRNRRRPRRRKPKSAGKDPPMIEVFVAIGSNLADPSARLVAPSPRWRPCPSRAAADLPPLRQPPHGPCGSAGLRQCRGAPCHSPQPSGAAGRAAAHRAGTGASAQG
jgi:poly(A) polymerase